MRRVESEAPRQARSKLFPPTHPTARATNRLPAGEMATAPPPDYRPTYGGSGRTSRAGAACELPPSTRMGRLIWGLKRSLRFNFLRIVREKSSAHRIAMGAAIGVFVGWLPIIPFQAVTVLALALIFRANKVLAFACTMFSNVFTLLPFYYACYTVGAWVTPFHVDFDMETIRDIHEIFRNSWRLGVTLMTGGFAIGLPSSVLAYFVAVRVVLIWRKRRALMLLKRKQEL